MSWSVYILLCSDKTYYTGITNDISRRIEQHNSGKGAKYTKGRTPVELLYCENHPDRSSAARRELEIKALPKNKKEELIKAT